jgi:hypothetical protein
MNATILPSEQSIPQRAQQVTRLTELDLNTYGRDYLEPGRPFVLDRGAAHWAAIQSWTLENVRARLGERRVPIKTYKPHARHAFPTITYMTVSQYLDRQAEPEGRRFRMGDLRLEDFFPELLPEIERPELVVHPGYRTGIFMGIDTFCGAHFHSYDEAILTQVTGTKHVVLYPPSSSHCLYPVPWYTPFHNWSKVNVEHPDEVKFPLFRAAEAFVATLEPGDMLFIPVHWWHATFGVGYSTSLTYFWRSNLRRWSFPFPGLRVMCSPYLLYLGLFLLARRIGRVEVLVDGLVKMGKDLAGQQDR